MTGRLGGGCRRHYCPGCGEEMIHRDHRRPWESSSAFGQLVHRQRHTFTAGDVDLYLQKRTTGSLRLLEHKQPESGIGQSQRIVLRLLDDIIAHYVNCPAVSHRLNPISGVYLVMGDLEAATAGHREVTIAGPQSIWSPRFGTVVVTDESELADWLDQ